MKVLYTTTANATGDGRNGHTELEDGSVSFDMRVPAEMGGPGGGANPEQLFALGYAACFHSALKVVAGADRSDVSDSEVSATVGIGLTPKGGFALRGRARRQYPESPRRSGAGPRRAGPRGVPVLQCDEEQHRREARRGLTTRAGRTAPRR